MKVYLFGYLMLMSLPVYAHSSNNKIVQNEKDIIQATLNWQVAYDSRQLNQIISLYDTSATFLGTTANTIASTPSEIKAYFTKSVKRKSSRVMVDEQHIRVYDNFATSTGIYTFIIKINGQTKHYPARFSFVYKKKGTQWMIIQHHSSQMPK